MKNRGLLIVLILAVIGVLAFAFWRRQGTPDVGAYAWLLHEPGTVQDEALRAGRTAASFPAADEDFFHDMDGGADLALNEVRGRNNWIVWTGGGDWFWDFMAQYTLGGFDLLKLLSSHPSLKFSRDNRWYWFGVVNEPGFEKWTPPAGCNWTKESCGDPQRYGLWLDRELRDPDPFANAAKYPGVAIGARGKNLPVGSFYGDASGVVGLRIFPNPAFDEAAAKRWDPYRYYNDAAYYSDPNLVRPYRVGMSCGFCHVGPSPIHPPADPEHPEWADLNSNPGSQYFWFDRIFMWDADQSNFLTQWYKTYLPGTLDTSLVSSDNINNPRTMNAIYNVPARMGAAKRWHEERLAGGGLENKQFNDYPEYAAYHGFFEPPDRTWTPMVLKDGADSVGILGALNRVYVNIGLFGEEWSLHFLPAIGGKKITPFEIAVAEKNSTYWNATTNQSPDVAAFFLATAKPDHLKDAPGGAAYLTTDKAKLDRGKVVFAENCARCHSSKQPPVLCRAGEPCPAGGVIENTGEHVAWLRNEVMKDDFLADNFLSTERRVPVTELGTNICSPLATNAIAGNIWDNFSSQTYKDLPSVGKVTLQHPLDGSEWEYTMPAGGRGYTRVPSLVSLWSTAPFLLNNSVGKFRWEASVEARMDSFDDSIQKMLWPEKRERDEVLGDKLPGYIQRTDRTSYLKVPPGVLPPFLRDVLGNVEIGPIPKGTPVNLLASLDVTLTGDLGEDAARTKKLIALVKKMVKDLKAVKGKSDEEAKEVFKNLVPDLMALSKCPDFVVNKGHYFGTNLPDDDKWALIEFLKTF